MRVSIIVASLGLVGFPWGASLAQMGPVPQTIDIPEVGEGEVALSQPEQAGGRQLITLGGVIENGEIKVDQMDVSLGTPPKYAEQPQEVNVKVIDEQGNTLYELDVADPRILETVEGPPETFLQESAHFQLILPYVPGATAVEIGPGEDYQKVLSVEAQNLEASGETEVLLESIRVDLRDAYRVFCIKQAGDEACRESFGLRNE